MVFDIFDWLGLSQGGGIGPILGVLFVQVVLGTFGGFDKLVKHDIVVNVAVEVVLGDLKLLQTGDDGVVLGDIWE